jgi:hypothetical protein
LFSPWPAWRKTVGLALFLAALTGPLSIHILKNYRIHHEIIPLITYSWINFWTAHNTFEPPDHNFYGPYLDALREGFPGARPEPREDLSPRTRDRMEMKKAFSFIAAHPGLTCRRTVAKVEDLFHPSLYIYRNFYVAPEGSFLRRHLSRAGPLILVSLTYVAMMLLGSAGIIFCPERRVRSFALMLIAFQVALAAFFFGPTRFRMTFVPMLVIFMGWAVVNSKEVWRRKRSWQGALTAGLWALMLLDWAKISVALVKR